MKQLSALCCATAAMLAGALCVGCGHTAPAAAPPSAAQTAGSPSLALPSDAERNIDNNSQLTGPQKAYLKQQLHKGTPAPK